jgi:hypothetical protein
MPGPEIWGPPVWTLFHVLASKCQEDQFKNLFPQLFHYIKRICVYLPCPDCSNHATQHLSKIKPQNIKCKKDFINMLYIFHNVVNTRKRKPLFNYENVDKYKNMNIIATYNRFIGVYNTKGNMQMLTESFQRQFVINGFKTWLMDNIKYFH